MARTIGITPLTSVEQQGYSKERLASQIEGKIPYTKICNITGKPYTAYRKDPDHPRWQQPKEVVKKIRPKKTETLDLDDLEEAA